LKNLREINSTIRQKLIEVEQPLRSIEQWYERMTNLDKYWRESRQEEEKSREKKETSKQTILTNTERVA